MRSGFSSTLAVLMLVGMTGTGAATETPAGTWLAASIGGKAVSEAVRSELDIGADGRVSGTGGCNRMMGKATIEAETIRFGHLAGTMMMCKPEVMEQERAFLAALEKAGGFRLDTGGSRLTLLDPAGKPLMVLDRR